MNSFFALLILLVFFAIVLFIGFVAGVLAATEIKPSRDGQDDDEKCPHGDNWDDCPDCGH